MTGARFLGKIDGPFICLTVTMLCHLLQCWRTGIFINKLAFTRSNARGKINRGDLWFSRVSGSLLAKVSGYSRKPQVLETGDKWANRKAGLLECHTQTWQNTEERFQGLIIAWIKTPLGANFAQEREKRIERTAGYSNNNDALRREFGIDLEPDVGELARGSRVNPADALGGLVVSALSGELVDMGEQVGESDREDLGDCVITTL